MNHKGTKTPRKAKGTFKKIPETTERLASEVVDAAYSVHVEMGPGLLESIYEECLVRELKERGLEVERQVSVPIEYKGQKLGEALKLDLLVGGELIVELKAVVEMHPVYTAQLLSYLRLSGRRLGLLINFNVEKIRDGLHRVVL